MIKSEVIDAAYEPEAAAAAATDDDAGAIKAEGDVAAAAAAVKEGQEEVAAPSADDTLPLSKRAARREKRRAIFEGKKERKKLQRKADRPPQPVPELDMSADAVLRRRERTVAKRETYLMAAEEGITVVIDCGFEEDMDSREKKSLSQQIMCVACYCM